MKSTSRSEEHPFVMVLEEAMLTFRDENKRREYDQIIVQVYQEKSLVKSENTKKIQQRDIEESYKKYGNSVKNPHRNEKINSFEKIQEENHSLTKYFYLKTALYFLGMAVFIAITQAVWFEPPKSNRMFIITICMGLYTVCSFLFLRNTYYWWIAKRMVKQTRVEKIENRTIALFMGLTFLVPAVFLRVMEYKREWHLTHYPSYVKPFAVSIENENTGYAKYMVNNREYIQEYDISDQFQKFYKQLGSNNKIWVLYSAKDPRISDLLIEKP